MFNRRGREAIPPGRGVLLASRTPSPAAKLIPPWLPKPESRNLRDCPLPTAARRVAFTQRCHPHSSAGWNLY
jgi:hypothetical protein